MLMIMGNYERILKVISKSSGLGESEIEAKVEAKRSKLAGLISREGAAQVVAAELGISFDNEKIKIDELSPGMKKVNMVGKVLDISPVRTFTRDGKEGKVANMFIADDTSNIKIVLWDINHISLIEKGDIVVDKVIEISNGNMRDNEVHLGSFSDLKLSSEVLENVKTEKIVKEKNISDFRLADNVSVRAFIVQAFEPRYFDVCPECKRKALPEGDGYNCKDHGKIAPEKRALINLVLDDGTETIRCVLFHENIDKLGIDVMEEIEKVMEKKQNLVGKELIFSGNVRNNSYFNNIEFIVEDVKEINHDELIASLQNS